MSDLINDTKQKQSVPRRPVRPGSTPVAPDVEYTPPPTPSPAPVPIPVPPPESLASSRVSDSPPYLDNAPLPPAVSPPAPALASSAPAPLPPSLDAQVVQAAERNQQSARMGGIAEPSFYYKTVTDLGAPIERRADAGSFVQRPGEMTTQQIADANTLPGLNRQFAEEDAQRKRTDTLIDGLSQETYTPYVYNPPEITNPLEVGASQRLAIWQNAARSDARAVVISQMLANAATTPRPNDGSVGDGLDWVRNIIGQRDGDNRRKYLSPVTFNKQTQEYEGNGFGTVLYPLGLIFNAAAGAALDVRQALRMVGNSMPPWWRNNQAQWLEQYRRATGGGPLIDFFANPNKYDDGKSNFIEALRGAQYSFGDEAGEGFGIKTQRGAGSVNLPLVGKVDYNPTQLLGIGIDVGLGFKVDKIFERGARAIGIGKKAVDVAATPAAAETARATARQNQRNAITPAAQSYEQLQLPLVPSAPKVKTKTKYNSPEFSKEAKARGRAEVNRQNKASIARTARQGDQLGIPGFGTPKDWRHHAYKKTPAYAAAKAGTKRPPNAIELPRQAPPTLQRPKPTPRASIESVKLPPFVGQNFGKSRSYLAQIDEQVKATVKAREAYAAERAARPLAYKNYVTRNKSGQLELPLGVGRNAVEPLPKAPTASSAAPVVGEQLNIFEFMSKHPAYRKYTTRRADGQLELALDVAKTPREKLPPLVQTVLKSPDEAKQLNLLSYVKKNPSIEPYVAGLPEGQMELLLNVKPTPAAAAADDVLDLADDARSLADDASEQLELFDPYGQIELPLYVPTNKQPAVNAALRNPTAPSPGRQLNIFRQRGAKGIAAAKAAQQALPDTLPQLVDSPVATDTAIKAAQSLMPKLPPSPINDVLNAMADLEVARAGFDNAVDTSKAAESAVGETADIGRKLVDEDLLDDLSDTAPTPTVVPLDTLPTTKLPDDLPATHASRVADLTLENADPVVGSARHELGVGHYSFVGESSRSKALLAGGKVSDNLPPLDGRVFTEDVRLHDINLRGTALDAKVRSAGLLEIAQQASRQFPQVVDALGTQPKSLVELFDEIGANASEETALHIQRNIAESLRSSGIDHIIADDVAASINPQAIVTRGVTYAGELGRIKPEEMLALRGGLEEQVLKATGSDFTRTALAETRLQEAAQGLDSADLLLGEAQQAVQNAVAKSGLLDDIPMPMLSLPVEAVDNLPLPMLNLPLDNPLVLRAVNLAEQLRVQGPVIAGYAEDLIAGVVKAADNPKFQELTRRLLNGTLDVADDVRRDLVDTLMQKHQELFDSVADKLTKQGFEDVFPPPLKKAGKALDELLLGGADDNAPAISELLDELDDTSFERNFEKNLADDAAKGGSTGKPFDICEL